MYKFLLLLCSFFPIKAQTTFVPDDNFEQALIDLGYDDIIDGQVITSNISNIQILFIDYKFISDLTGLQDFSSLTDLNIDNNLISNIPLHPDVNLNFLACQRNQLTDLDLTQHTNLFELAFATNNISNIDFTKNTHLHYVVGGDNPIEELDFSNNSNLLEVRFYDNLVLQTVDIRNGNNNQIQEFAFTNSPNLPYIYVDDCKYSKTNWTSIDPTTAFIEEEGQIECDDLNIEGVLEDFNVVIYPNPVKDSFSIHNLTSFSINNISIFNVDGKKILSITDSYEKISISNIPSGLYFVYIQTDYKTLNTKIIKK